VAGGDVSDSLRAVSAGALVPAPAGGRAVVMAAAEGVGGGAPDAGGVAGAATATCVRTPPNVKLRMDVRGGATALRGVPTELPETAVDCLRGVEPSPASAGPSRGVSAMPVAAASVSLSVTVGASVDGAAVLSLRAGGGGAGAVAPVGSSFSDGDRSALSVKALRQKPPLAALAGAAAPAVVGVAGGAAADGFGTAATADEVPAALEAVVALAAGSTSDALPNPVIAAAGGFAGDGP